MSIVDYLRLVFSQPFFVFALILSVFVFVLGIVLNIIAKLKTDRSSFSGGLYDLLVLGIEAAIVFGLSIMAKTNSLATDSFTNLPLLGVLPNPADIVQVIIQHNILGMLSIGGRVWLQGLMIELFTEMIMDMYPPKSIFSHYLRVGAIVIPTVLLNILLNFFLEECVSFNSEIIFAGVFILGMIITIILAIRHIKNKEILGVVENIFFTVGHIVLWTFILGCVWGAWYRTMPEWNVDIIEEYQPLVILLGILAFAFLALMHLLYILLKKPFLEKFKKALGVIRK